MYLSCQSKPFRDILNKILDPWVKVIKEKSVKLIKNIKK